MTETVLDKITPDADLTGEQRKTIYEHLRRRLAVHRNEAGKWEDQEYSVCGGKSDDADSVFIREINVWADALAENAWLACGEPGKGELSSFITPNTMFLIASIRTTHCRSFN